MHLDLSTFEGRLNAITARMAAAAARAGREADAVSLLAVSKTYGPERITEAFEHGLQFFGESRVQEAVEKIPQCPGRIRWHFIGHLQRNKVKYVLPLFDMVHSVDSLALLEMLEAGCQATGEQIRVCLQVNVSGERCKFGMPPDVVPSVLAASTGMSGVSVEGLMTIPPFDPDPEAARPFFAHLRQLSEKMRLEEGFQLDHLSMGMSHDFEVAIEEGATLVRIGSALFGPRGKVKSHG